MKGITILTEIYFPDRRNLVFTEPHSRGGLACCTAEEARARYLEGNFITGAIGGIANLRRRGPASHRERKSSAHPLERQCKIKGVDVWVKI
jgi:hypothetical protein